MNEDDIIFQPDVPKTEDVKEETGETDDEAVPVPLTSSQPDSDAGAEDSASPRVFDFSSDFNISPVADEAPASSGNDTKIGKSNALPPSKPAPAPTTAPKNVPPAKPVTQYREPVDQTQKWPFAFGAPSASPTKQPLMNPSASAAVDPAPKPAPKPTPATPVAKSMPSSQPVKTIKADGGEQASEKELQHPKTDLQRDILAILPNMRKGDAPEGGKAALQNNPKFTAAPNSDLKPLRTYESDVAEVLSHRNMSSASIAIAESKRKTGEARLSDSEQSIVAQPHAKRSFNIFKRAPKMPAAEEPELMPTPMPAPKPAPKREPIPEPAPEPMPTLAPKLISREEAFRRDSFPPKPAEDSFKGAVIMEDAPEPKAPSHIVRNLTLTILSLALVGGGLYGGYYLYMHSALSVRAPQTTNPAPTITSSLVPSDSQALISTAGLNAQAIAAHIQAEIAKPQNPNTIKDIVLTQTVAGAEKQIAPADIARALNIAVPDVVLRTIQPKWMLGVYADASGMKDTFIAATTDNFQNALSGMLNWESLMPNAFNSFIQPGTTTPLQGSFIDEIVKNKDVRAFVEPADERTIFLYSFVNDSTVVVSNTEVALSEVVTRLENQAFVR